MTLDKNFLATIRGINCESTGRLPASCSLEEIQSWCEQWLYEQESLEVDTNEAFRLAEDLEIGIDDAARQLAVDAAEVAWRESQEWTPDNVSFAAVA